MRGEDGIALIRNRYKLLRTKTATEFELYDLQNDPAETTDLAEQMPDKDAGMKAELEAWMGSAMNSLKGADYTY